MNHSLLPVFLLTLLLTVPLPAAQVLANFETGTLSGWSATGSAWTVGGSTGSVPNILTTEGNYFARSGAPNVLSGELAEFAPGSLTSPAFAATYDTLSWSGTGWSGSNYDGQSKYEILDANMNVVAQFATAQSDSWETYTANLISIGIAPGGTFYFRAVDARSDNTYAWMALDNLLLDGTAQTAATPEPATFAAAALALSAFAVLRRK